MAISIQKVLKSANGFCSEIPTTIWIWDFEILGDRGLFFSVEKILSSGGQKMAKLGLYEDKKD